MMMLFWWAAEGGDEGVQVVVVAMKVSGFVIGMRRSVSHG